MNNRNMNKTTQPTGQEDMDMQTEALGSPHQPMDAPLTDKDGTIRWDYWVKLERWEDDEYVITVGGLPIGQTVGYREGKAIQKWLPTMLGNSMRPMPPFSGDFLWCPR